MRVGARESGREREVEGRCEREGEWCEREGEREWGERKKRVRVGAREGLEWGERVR